MRKVGFYLLILSMFVAINCTRNTAVSYRDGRIFGRIDSPPSLTHHRHGYLWIITEVEGYEPFTTKIFDFEYSRAAQWVKEFNINREETLNWNDIQGKPIDLTGKLIEGGRQVQIEAFDPITTLQRPRVTFRVDGNSLFSIYFATSDTMPGGVTQLRIRRLQ